MAIEVRQLIVKTTIEQKTAVPAGTEGRCCDVGQLKAELLKQCRQLIVETLRRERER